MLKKSLSLVTTSVALFIGFGYGCSSSSDNTGTPTTEAGPTEDTGPAKDSGGKTDAGKTETGGGDDGSVEPTCAPGDVSSFAPSWKPPNPLHSGDCSADQAEQWVLCQLDPSQDQAACKAFAAEKANADCAKCIFTPSSATKLGPVIELPGSLVKRNVDGCVANLDGNTDANSCAAKAQAAAQCGEAACEDNCPVPSGDDAALKALNDCETESQTGACKTFADEGACMDDLTKAGGVGEPCLEGNDFVSNAVVLAKLFCAPAGDAGTKDAAGDGG